MSKHIANRKLIVRILLYTAYFLAAFLLFLYLNLPLDGIRSRLEHEVHSRTPLELSMSRLSVELCDLVMHEVVISDKTGKVLFESPKARLGISFLGLIRGVFSAKIDAEAYGGGLFIKLRSGKDFKTFYVDADGLDIGSYRMLKDLGMQITGEVGGNFDMTGENGRGRLWLKGLGWRGLKIKGFSVPDIDFEQAWLDAEMKGSRLFIKKLQADGKDIKVRISGDIALRQNGQLNLSVMLKPSEPIAREHAGLLSLLKKRDSEGFYRFDIGGTLDAPAPRL